MDLENNAITHSQTCPIPIVVAKDALANGSKLNAGPQKKLQRIAGTKAIVIPKRQGNASRTESKRSVRSPPHQKSEPRQTQPLQRKALIQGAETGRPETGREFAARMRDRFVLKGPRDPKEGMGPEPDLETRKTPIGETEGTTRSTPPVSLISVVKDTAGIDLMSVIRDKYIVDTFFKMILESPKDYRNFEVENGLIYQRGDGGHVLRTPNGLHDGRSIKEIVISEAHGILAHLSARKTFAYLQDHVWWK
ncbi:hypothetical protein FA13DRAFT_1641521, partial [Coprinellus micaceus]